MNVLIDNGYFVVIRFNFTVAIAMKRLTACILKTMYFSFEMFIPYTTLERIAE